jgi:hypothetical protein
MSITCFHCKSSLPIPVSSGRAVVAFRESCSSCGTDLHVCLNCKFYDSGAHHECRESSAEWVKDKERANKCEYFVPLDGSGSTGQKAKESTLADLDALFKK